jgi:hypothetical protein
LKRSKIQLQPPQVQRGLHPINIYQVRRTTDSKDSGFCGRGNGCNTGGATHQKNCTWDSIGAASPARFKNAQKGPVPPEGTAPSLSKTGHPLLDWALVLKKNDLYFGPAAELAWLWDSRYTMTAQSQLQTSQCDADL